jgi:hypothetical protein
MSNNVVNVNEMLLDLEGFHSKIQKQTEQSNWDGVQELVKERHKRIKNFIEKSQGSQLNQDSLTKIQKKIIDNDKELHKVLVENKNSLVRSRINLRKSYKGANEYRKTSNNS